LNEMRVIDMNFATMTTVIGLRDKYGFSKCLFEVTRHGAKGDTKTTYQILPEKDDMPSDLRAIIGTPNPNDRNAWNEGTVPLIDLEEATARAEDDAAVADDVKRTAKETKSKETKPATAAAPATTPANGTNGHAAPATATTAAVPPQAAANAPPLSKEAVAVIIAKLKPLDREKGVDLFLARFPYAKKVSEVHASDEAAAVAYANQLAAPPAAEDPFA